MTSARDGHSDRARGDVLRTSNCASSSRRLFLPRVCSGQTQPAVLKRFARRRVVSTWGVIVRILASLVLVLLVPVSVGAQSVAVFGGYEWAHPDFDNVHLLTSDLNGWRVGAAVAVVSGLEIVAQADGLYGKTFNTGVVIRPIGAARPWFYSVEAGPRYTVHPAGRMSPFVEGLLGVAHGQVATMGIDFIGTTTDTRLAGGVTGGLVVHLTRTLGIQAEVAYRRSQLFNQRLSRLQVGGDVVWSPERK
jgi:hypothetical protein